MVNQFREVPIIPMFIVIKTNCDLLLIKMPQIDGRIERKEKKCMRVCVRAPAYVYVCVGLCPCMQRRWIILYTRSTSYRALAK